MKATQLELELWDQLQLAQQMPEAIDVTQLLNVMEVTAAQLPEAQRLQFAGDALLEMAELCAARAGVLMTQWEERYRDPVVEQNFFADVVRQTMAVDLSDLMEPAPPRKRRAKSTCQPEGSIAAPVDKAAVLAMMDQLEADEEAQKQQVLAIAHSENVSEWIKAISQWLQTALPPVSIVELSCGLEMPWTEVWLGVLFGGFQLEQRGEFYESPIWVKCFDEQAMTLRQNGQLEAEKLGLAE
jgi:hypothetical protein